MSEDNYQCVGSSHKWDAHKTKGSLTDPAAITFPCKCGELVMVVRRAKPQSLFDRIRARAARLRRRG